jgi:transposase
VSNSEIVERGYQGGLTQARTFMRLLQLTLPVDPVVRFETEIGEQLKVDWLEFRKGNAPLHAFLRYDELQPCYHVEFVSNTKVAR